MRISQDVLKQALSSAEEKVKVGGLYYHYKNPDQKYRVLDLGINESDHSVCVIYQAQYGEKLIFVRPLVSWLDNVESQSQTTNRFTLVG